jgi:hypothetical protein
MMSWSRLTDRTLSDVNNGDRHASKNTYVILERALDWQPGSIDMILAGDEPIADGVEEPQDEPKAVALDIRDASIRELVEELGRRLDTNGLRLTAADFRVWWRAGCVKRKRSNVEPVRTRRPRSVFLNVFKLNYRHALRGSVKFRAIESHSITPVERLMPCDRRIGR